VAGTFRSSFSEICTELSRLASPMQLVPYFAPPTRPLGLIDATPAFSAPARVGRPPVAPSLLPKITSDERPDLLGPAFSLRFKLIIKKRSLREQHPLVLLHIVLSTGVYCRPWFAGKGGEASIFYPENGSYHLAARVQMDEWPRLAAAK
jgi:hypothetical protein